MVDGGSRRLDALALFNTLDSCFDSTSLGISSLVSSISTSVDLAIVKWLSSRGKHEEDDWRDLIWEGVLGGVERYGDP